MTGREAVGRSCLNDAETRWVYTEEQTERQAGPGEAEREEGGKAEFWRRGCTRGPRAGPTSKSHFFGSSILNSSTYIVPV